MAFSWRQNYNCHSFNLCGFWLPIHTHTHTHTTIPNEFFKTLSFRQNRGDRKKKPNKIKMLTLTHLLLIGNKMPARSIHPKNLFNKIDYRVSIRTVRHKQESLEMELNDAYMNYVILFTIHHCLSVSLSLCRSATYLATQIFRAKFNETKNCNVFCSFRTQCCEWKNVYSAKRNRLYLFLCISRVPVFCWEWKLRRNRQHM